MKKSIYLPLLATIGLLGVTAAALRFAEIRTPGSLVQPLEAVPRSIAAWQTASDLDLSPSIVDALKATTYLRRLYRHNQKELELFVAYYSEQRAGESIHTPKHCLPAGGWEIAEMGTIAVPFAGTNVKVNNYVVQQGNERLRILYWYHSRSRIVANEYAAKLYLARDAMLRGSTDGAIVKIVIADRPGALEEAVAFAQGVLPNVQKCFGPEMPSLALAR